MQVAIKDYFPPIDRLIRPEPKPRTLAQIHRSNRRIGRELRAMEQRLEYRG